ncbi:hypothetical protein [Ensifer sp. 4252]|uniref:hypothetical protein n=1 Tax=Ensifer sp. 4252 TaxID=3373915 RepID=UPI003D20365F
MTMPLLTPDGIFEIAGEGYAPAGTVAPPGDTSGAHSIAVQRRGNYLPRRDFGSLKVIRWKGLCWPSPAR